MSLLSQPENSNFSINQIKVIDFNFKQFKDILNIDKIYLNVSLNAQYIHVEDKKELRPMLSMEITISSEDNKENLATFKGTIFGFMSYKDEFNEKLLPNLISILYSYLRPLVAQMSVMGKLPPIDLPVLNLSEIKVVEIKPEEKNTGETPVNIPAS